MLQYAKEGKISIEKVVEKMSHAPAVCFNIAERGYLREGYHADMVLVNMNEQMTVTKQNLLYKCGWSPFEGHTFPVSVHTTFVNGDIAYTNGQVNDACRGQRVKFSRG
jgi:dihydroorotase